MPFFTEIVSKFKGKGSKKIFDWAQGGDEYAGEYMDKNLCFADIVLILHLRKNE